MGKRSLPLIIGENDMDINRILSGKMAAVFKGTDTVEEIAAYSHCTVSELLTCLNRFIDKREEELEEIKKG